MGLASQYENMCRNPNRVVIRKTNRRKGRTALETYQDNEEATIPMRNINEVR